jgi:hypothetical protein
MFLNADIPHGAAWHTLRVTMTGDHIECYYDDKKYLDVRDSTFAEAGADDCLDGTGPQRHDPRLPGGAFGQRSRTCSSILIRLILEVNIGVR